MGSSTYGNKFYDVIDDNATMLHECYVYFSRNIIRRHAPSAEVVRLACDLLELEALARIVDGLKTQPDYNGGRISGILADAFDEPEQYPDAESVKRKLTRTLVAYASCIDSETRKREFSLLLYQACGLVQAELPPVRRIPVIGALGKTFKLDDNQLLIALYYYVVGTHPCLKDVQEEWRASEMFNGASIATGLPMPEVTRNHSRQSPLIMNDIISYEDVFNETYSFNSVLSGVFALGDPSAIFANYLDESRSETHPLDSFGIDARSLGVCTSLVAAEAAAHILLYGAEGTGKTEFAKTLAAACGKRLFFLRREEKSHETFTKLRMAAASVEAGTIVIAVDEAEDLLNGQIDKARINLLMDDARCTIIWIVNDTDSIVRSTARRFGFSLKFDPLPSSRIVAIARKTLAHLPVPEPVLGEIIQVVEHKGLNAASGVHLKASLDAVLRNDGTVPGQELVSIADTVLDASLRLLDEKVDHEEKPEDKTYYSGALNLSIQPERLEGAFRKAAASGTRGVRALFHGYPGTGKTALAHHLAAVLGVKAVIKRASDILDPLVGMSEQRVASLFKEAAERKELLIIDEVEAFLYNRSRAVRSWELSLVDEFLTQIDSYAGFLVCTTNHPGMLDNAVLRRFHLQVEFKALEDSGVKLLLERYFPGLEFGPFHLERLAGTGPLVPADFARARDSFDLFDEQPDVSRIVESLVEATKDRRPARTLGFAG